MKHTKRPTCGKSAAYGLSAVILTSVMFFGAACGNGAKSYDPDNFIADTSSEQIVKEKITLNFFTMKASMHGEWEEMRLFEELERRTNIHVEFEEVLVSNVEQIKGLRWEDSKNLPDAFFLGNQPYELEQMSQAGALRELSGYDEYTGNTQKNLLELYAPNYMSWIDRFNDPEQEGGYYGDPFYDVETIGKQSDGKTYTFCSIDATGGICETTYINKKWIDDLGLANNPEYCGESGLPETTEQFYNVLKAFKTYDPNGNGKQDEIPFMVNNLSASLNYILCAFGYVDFGTVLDGRETILDDSGNSIANPDYNQMVWVPATSGYREYLQYMNKLYAEKLINESMFTATQADVAAAAVDGRVGCFTANGSYYIVGDQLDDQYVALPPLTSEHNDTLLSWRYTDPVTPGVVMIPVTTPYYREIIRWIDAFYDLANEALQQRGLEGEDWFYDETSEPAYDPVRGEWLQKWRLNNTTNLADEDFRATLTYQAGLDNVIMQTIDSNNSSDVYRAKMIEDRNAMKAYMRSALPPLSYTLEQFEQIADLEDSLSTYMTTASSNFIKGNTDPFSESEYGEFLSRMAIFDYQKLLGLYNTVYAEIYTN